MTAAAIEPQVSPFMHASSRVLSGLGAAGVALQNYPAVALFINSLVKGTAPLTQASSTLIHSTALATGGIASGMVNFWMNVELLDGFFQRMNSTKEYQYIRYKLDTWQQLQYFGGILVFVITGILFGLMAFTFAMEGPLAILSIAAGLFVAGIMTIQEVETWLSSYDDKYDPNPETALPEAAESLSYFQKLGKNCGHFIAAGNVLALSLLFTLSLAQALIALQIAALPALIIGFVTAFTFGAFTEYFFYNAYLAKFGQDLEKNWALMMAIPHAWIGLVCISTNAFVNAALTYAGVELLTGVLVAANIALPPVAAITTLATISAIFAGSASFILGTAFWIRNNPPKPEVQSHPESLRVSRVSQVSMYQPAPAANDLSIIPQANQGYSQV